MSGMLAICRIDSSIQQKKKYPVYHTSLNILSRLSSANMSSSEVDTDISFIGTYSQSSVICNFLQLYTTMTEMEILPHIITN